MLRFGTLDSALRVGAATVRAHTAHRAWHWALSGDGALVLTAEPAGDTRAHRARLDARGRLHLPLAAVRAAGLHAGDAIALSISATAIRVQAAASGRSADAGGAA